MRTGAAVVRLGDMRIAIVLMMVVSCGVEPVTTPDAGFDFYGEACEAASSNPEVVSRCRGDEGVCVDSTCRPACAHEFPACPGGSGVIAPSGLCYCAPE